MDQQSHTYLVCRDGTSVEGAFRVGCGQYGLQTSLTEEVSTLCLHGVPHGVEADGALVPLEEGVEKVLLVATKYRHPERCN